MELLFTANISLKECRTVATSDEMFLFISVMNAMSVVFDEGTELDVTQPATFYIKGYPVDYLNPIPVDPSDSDYLEHIPLFSKTENSKIYYAAGWYAVNFEKGWKHANCPKLNTLVMYGYEGPFKTNMELKQRLKVLNKLKRQAQKNV